MLVCVVIKDEDGKVIIQPPNAQTKNPKKGHTDEVYFSRSEYTTIGDPFKRNIVDKVLRDQDPEGHKKLHDLVFKPAKTVKVTTNAAYEHMNERVEVKKDFRDADGAVVTAPKNITTCATKKGKDSNKAYFNPFPEAIPDDFNWPRKVARKEMEEKKKLEQEKPFSQRAKTWGGFNTIREVFGEEPLIPARPARKASEPPMEQEAAWKPAKPARSGYSCTFEKFPEYKENPLKHTQRKRPVEGEEPGPAFRSTYMYRSRPTPSVVTNLRNMKSSFPSVFKR